MLHSRLTVKEGDRVEVALNKTNNISCYHNGEEVHYE